MLLTWEQQQTLGEVVRSASWSAHSHDEPLSIGHIAAAFWRLKIDSRWEELPDEWSLLLFRSLCPEQVATDEAIELLRKRNLLLATV